MLKSGAFARILLYSTLLAVACTILYFSLDAAQAVGDVLGIH